MTRSHRDSCPECHRAYCRCDAAATRWAAERGERVPAESDKRLFGDNVARATDLERLESERRDRADMRAHLDMLRMRIAQVRKVAAMIPRELDRLELHERVLGAFVGGRLLREISADLGYRTHSVASEIMAEIRREASWRDGPTGPAIVLPCACGRAGCVVVQRVDGGRPRRWATDKCRRLGQDARRRRVRQRRRERRAVAQIRAVSVDGSAAHTHVATSS